MAEGDENPIQLDYWLQAVPYEITLSVAHRAYSYSYQIRDPDIDEPTPGRDTMSHAIHNTAHWAELVDHLSYEVDVTEPGAEFFVVVMTEQNGGRAWRSEGMDYHEFRDEDLVIENLTRNRPHSRWEDFDVDKVVVEIIFNPAARAKWPRYQDRVLERDRFDASYILGVPYRGRVAPGPRWVQGGPQPAARVPRGFRRPPPVPASPPAAAASPPPLDQAELDREARANRRDNLRHEFRALPQQLLTDLTDFLDYLDRNATLATYTTVHDRLLQIYNTQSQEWLRENRPRIEEQTRAATDVRGLAIGNMYLALIDWRLAELEAVRDAGAPGIGLGFSFVDPPIDPFADAKADFQRRHRRFFGAYDQQRIERARPKQNLEWYAKHSQVLRQIKNKDFRCLEFCIAIYNKYRELKIKEWRAKGLLEYLNPLEEARHAEIKAPDKAAVAHYARSWTRGRMVKDAKKIEEQVWGREVVEQYGDFARDLNMLVYYHNALKTRFQAFSFNESGTLCRPVARSWQMEDAMPLPLNSPLITLLWTPPPADEPDGIGHFDLIPPFVNLAVQYLNTSTQYRFCAICAAEVPIAGHPCKGPFCQLCGHWNCPGADLAQAYDLKECGDCHGKFRGDVCLANHKKRRPSGSDTLLLQTMDMAMVGESMPFVLKPSHPKAKTQLPMCDVRFFCACNDFKSPFPRFVEARSHRDDNKKPLRYAHRCGYHLCPHCDEHLPLGHKCCVTVKEVDVPADPSRYVCVDIECDNRNAHRPYLIRVAVGLGTTADDGILGGYDAKGQRVERGDELMKGEYDALGNQVWFWFEGPEAGRDFIKWCLAKRDNDKQGFTVLAFNGSNYDYAVLYPDLFAATTGATRRSINPVYRGTQLISLSIGRGKTAIHFRDFMLHTGPRSLSSLIKTYGLKSELERCGLSGLKDHFPHNLHKPLGAQEDFTDYDGPLPLRECYIAPHEPSAREEFYKWHQQEAKKYTPYTEQTWNFWQQAKLYNHNDVEILRRAARVYRQNAMKSSGIDCDPLQYITTPSACLALFRARDMDPGSIPNYSIEVNRLFRTALYGGRTEATQFYWPQPDTPPTERLFKIDINSLYPHVEAKYRYPIGYPSELIGRPGLGKDWPYDLWVEDDEKHKQAPHPVPAERKILDGLLDQLLSEETFAFLVVDVTPPTDLIAPVLGHKANGKLKFTLEPLHQYSVFSPMLRKAREKGYVIDKLWGAAWWDEAHCPPPSVGIFRNYVARELREKDEANGWPAGVVTEEQKQQYCATYASHPMNQLLGVSLRPDRVEKNDGRREVAKLRLNNLWGKMTQKELYCTTRLFFPDQMDEFMMYQLRRDIRRVRCVFLEDGIVEVAYRPEYRDRPKGQRDVEFPEEDDQADKLDPRRHPRPTGSIHAVIPGSLVPMYGQLEMYNYMDILGAQRCYMDTDSLIYRYDPENKEHKQLPEGCFGNFLGQFKDELKSDDGKNKVVKTYAAGGPKNYVLLYHGMDERKGTSTVKGLRRGKLHPGYQAAFLRAKVLQLGLGLSDLQGPSLHHVHFVQFLRLHKVQEVKTLDAIRRYDLVNDKVELFVDGSTLPLGHRDVASRRAEVDQKRDYWSQQLVDTMKALEDKQDEQDRWDGRAVGTFRAEAKRRREEADEKEDQQRAAQRVRLEEAGDRLRRENEDQAVLVWDDADEAALLEYRMMHESHPDPALFDGMMET